MGSNITFVSLVIAFASLTNSWPSITPKMVSLLWAIFLSHLYGRAICGPFARSVTKVKGINVPETRENEVLADEVNNCYRVLALLQSHLTTPLERNNKRIDANVVDGLLAIGLAIQDLTKAVKSLNMKKSN